MADLEFFFDPVCPWAWITSRWVAEVQQLREYDITWRFVSLAMINENRTDASYDDDYRAGHREGLYALRVCDEVRLQRGNDAVAAAYTALGTALHNGGRRRELSADPVGLFKEVLLAIGLPADLAAHAFDESHDSYIRADTELALSRTGDNVGTPILTFRPGFPDEGSFFGPVLSSIPRGDEAGRLWDAIVVIAISGRVAELKRSKRGTLSFD